MNSRKPRRKAAVVLWGWVFSGCASPYEPRYPDAVIKACGDSPVNPDRGGFSTAQGRWNDCATAQDVIADDLSKQTKIREAEQAALAAKKAEDDAANQARQDECKVAFLRLKEERELKPRDTNRCPNSGLAAGLYKSAGAPLYVELHVGGNGCAVYESVNQGTVTTPRKVLTSEGYYEQDYHRDWSCTAMGVVSEAGASVLGSMDRDCGAPGTMLTTHSRWAGKGASIVVSGGLLPQIELSKVADFIPEHDGLPALWYKQNRNKGTLYDLVSAKGPGANIDALYHVGPEPVIDWCADLEKEQAGALTP